MTKFTRTDYDQADELHRVASRYRRLASVEHMAGRMNTEDFLQVRKAEKRALDRWEEIRAQLFPCT